MKRPNKYKITWFDNGKEIESEIFSVASESDVRQTTEKLFGEYRMHHVRWQIQRLPAFYVEFVSADGAKYSDIKHAETSADAIIELIDQFGLGKITAVALP